MAPILIVLYALLFVCAACGVEMQALQHSAEKRKQYTDTLKGDMPGALRSVVLIGMPSLFLGVYMTQFAYSAHNPNVPFWAVEIFLCWALPAQIMFHCTPRLMDAALFGVAILCAAISVCIVPAEFSTVSPWLVISIVLPCRTPRGSFREKNTAWIVSKCMITVALVASLLLLCYCQHGTAAVWMVVCKGARYDRSIGKDSLCSIVSTVRGDVVPPVFPRSMMTEMVDAGKLAVESVVCAAGYAAGAVVLDFLTRG